MADARIIDPLGRTIVLHDRTWFGHVLKRHLEVTGHRQQAEATLAWPDSIHISPSDADVRLYFQRLPNGRTLLVVVANVIGGHVLTAHLVRNVKGVLEWSR